MATLTHPKLFFNRELSWLKFNERVLLESRDTTHPLLERVRFLAITSSNLDEFFMVRVGGLLEQKWQGIDYQDISGYSVEEKLVEIAGSAHRLVNKQSRLWQKISEELTNKKILIKSWDNLTEPQKIWLRAYFTDTVFPVLTPLAVDASHPFPFLANKSLNVAVLLEKEDEKKKKKKLRTAVIQLPSLLPRLIPLPDKKGQISFFPMELLLKHYAYRLFLGHVIQASAVFRITRNADFAVDDDGAEDLLTEMKKFLYQRSRGHTVRLEIEKAASKKLRAFLEKVLQIRDRQVYEIDGPLDLTCLNQLADHPLFPDLRYPALKPIESIKLDKGESLFDRIRQEDILLHHPFESFDPVILFIQEAAKDPKVLAIKQTLYRIGNDPRLITALTEAAQSGKQVTVVMEVKARFDEENNILRAKQLEEAGCHVIYGLPGLKTHSKITLIIRQEKSGLRRYLHLGTGNYNASTAKVYTDLGLLTDDPAFGEDATAFFNLLSGYSDSPVWRRLAVAPLDMRETFVRLIDRETQLAKSGKPGRIVAKMNSLFDQQIIEKLYEASQAGVEIDLIVRGICGLRPGIKGISDHIRVRSIIGRFLEHSRIFYFGNQNDPEIYLSSADWMHRNLTERVEILFPILAPSLKDNIKNLLSIYLADTSRTSRLRPAGTYHKSLSKKSSQMDSQVFLLAGKSFKGKKLK